HETEGFAIPMMRRCIIRVQFNSTPELRLGAREVPVVPKFHETEGSMRLGECFVDLQRSVRGGFRSCDKLAAGKLLLPHQQRVRVSHPGISGGICRIEIDCLSEVC